MWKQFDRTLPLPRGWRGFMYERAAAYASMKLRSHVHWEDPEQAGSDEYQRDSEEFSCENANHRDKALR